MRSLDSASARALAFALRRLDGAPVGVLVALRLGEAAAADRFELDASTQPERVPPERARFVSG